MPPTNRRDVVALLIAIAAAAFAVPARAQIPPMAPQARVVVTGEGSVVLAPDYAEVRSGVTARGKSAKEALDANSKLMTAVTGALQNSGVEPRDIQTARFSVAPVYAQQQSSNPRTLVGFEAVNQVAVTIHQLARLGDILDRMVAAGATDIGTVEFLHSDAAKALDQARQAAIADARRKAELYAQSAGLALGGVLWITEDAAAAAPLPARLMRAGVGGLAPPIFAGDDTLRATVTVGFDIAR